MASDVNRLIEDMERLRGKLRIAIRQTEDGLGIHIPPPRRFGLVAFLCLWLCGWVAGVVFALGQFVKGGIGFPDLFLLIWLVPWTLGGAAVFFAVVWQLFGVERLFFTADTLVREWGVPGFSRRRVVPGAEIVSVRVDDKMANDFAGLGAISVTTTGKSMRIGSGLERHEAELVALLIENAAKAGRPIEATEPDSGEEEDV